VLVAIGGGGLISGVATAMKEVNPRIRIIGVEAAALPKMQASRKAGHPVTIDASRTLADGIAVRRPGEKTFALIQKYVDEIVSCDDEETANAILRLLEREKTVAEGAGAITLAAALNRKLDLIGHRVALVIGGGNIDVNLVSRIIERGLVKDGRLVRLMVTIPDRPGSLAPLMQLIAQRRANVVEIHHNRTFSKAAVGDTLVELVLETRGPEHIAELIAELGLHGYTATRE
jgi:threonine dehydratase